MNEIKSNASTLVAVALAGALVGRGEVEIVACSPQAAQDVTTAVADVIKVADLACVLDSTLTDVQALHDFCKFERPLSPLTQNILSVIVGIRDMAKASGWAFRRGPSGMFKLEHATDGGK